MVEGGGGRSLRWFWEGSVYFNDLRNSLYLKINYTQPEVQSMTVKVNDKFVKMLQNK